MTPTLLREPMPYRTADTRELRDVHRVLRRFSRYLAAAAPVVRCGDPAAARAIAELAVEVAGVVRRLHAAERDRPDVTAKRQDWEQSLPGLAVQRLLFLDESAVNTAMVRACGRCARGRRLIDAAPAGLWQT